MTTSDTYTVPLSVINYTPVAVDDSFATEAPDSGGGVPLDVLANDYDSDTGDTFTVTSVGSTANGGTVTISAGGANVEYHYPSGGTSTIDTGATVTIGETVGDNGGDEVDATPTDDWDQNFNDSFTYTITDSVGATATAFVQVQKAAPVWTQKLLPAYDSAAEVGVDGTAGYKLFIRQEFGVKSPGIPAPAGTQSWQANTETTVNMFVDTTGVVRRQALSQTIADVNNIAGKTTPIRITDELGLKPTADTAKSIFMLEQVDKKLGFNAKNAKLPIGTYTAGPDQITTLGTMIGTPLQSRTIYMYVDKLELEARHTAGDIDNATYNAVKASIAGTSGMAYADIPDKYESFSISGLGSWTFP